MTRRTYEYLKQRKEALEEEVRDMGRLSEGHDRAAHHDDAGTVLHRERTQREIQDIGNLSGTRFVEPRQETDRVGVGNRVNIVYKTNGEEEDSHLVLPSEDRVHASSTGLGSVITPESPVGKAIIGKSAGTEVEVSTRPPIKARIKSIEPGDFE